MNDEQTFVMNALQKAGYDAYDDPSDVGDIVEIVLEAIADYTEKNEPHAIMTIRQLRDVASIVGTSLNS